MKASSKIFLFLTLLFSTVLPFTVQAADYVTEVKTPDDVVLKWATQIGEGWQKSAGVPLLADNSIVIISGDEILKVDPMDGSITLRAAMAASQSYGYVAPTYANGKIYMNLSDGIVQAFDFKTLKSEWIYKDANGGKGMTAVTYSDNVVYTGFWQSETADASFVALDATTGELLWSKTVNGGFYWAGAYCNDNAVIFATDDGTDKFAHIYSCNKKTGDVFSCIDVENKGDIRSSITYYNGRIYATTKGGYIVSAALKDNVLLDVKYGEIGAASTSTPVIYNDKIYIGAGDKTISVFDAITLEKLFAIQVSAYPQCSPLISTYYTEAGYIYLYTTYNKTPGGITLIKIKTDAESADDCIVTELYDAKGYEQYCISDIVYDNNGTLYYKNDSGYLFALSEQITVKVSFSEDDYIFEPAEIKVGKNTAEGYGYKDTVTDAVSTLDVLVKIHEHMLEDEFTAQTASEYLIVSDEGYLSRIMGTDTYNFGFAVNGAAPHDDVLTEYGYTGYSLNQAAVNNGDKVEFFIYRDSWAMDTYCSYLYSGVNTDFISLNKGETIDIKLVGYSFAWYSCYDEAMIESMTSPIAGAKILLNGSQIATTDKNGMFSLTLDYAGRYSISVKEGDSSAFLIPQQMDIDILGFDFIYDNDQAYLVSNLTEETEVLIITATYENDENVMTSSSLNKISIPEGYSKTAIETPDKETFKTFIWSNTLTPLIGGDLK